MTTLLRWFADWRQWRRDVRRAATLMRLSDHHLADIGLRRDQVQPDGIHALDLPPRPRALAKRPRAPRRGAAIRPSLQGCG